MIIDRRPLGADEFVEAEIYPFAKDKSETTYQDSIRVFRDGRVFWRHQEWTTVEAMEYLAQLQAAFAVAFKFAESKE